MDTFNNNALPMGFAMGVAMDMDAMNHFSNLTEAEKEEFLNRAKDAKSKESVKFFL